MGGSMGMWEVVVNPRDTKLWRGLLPKVEDASFAADALSGRIKFMECVDDALAVGHCIGNSATGEIMEAQQPTEQGNSGITRHHQLAKPTLTTGGLWSR
jgi:hypothetical protein